MNHSFFGFVAVYWPECTVLGKKIDGSAIRPQGLSQDTFDVDSMEQCSLNCTLQSDPKCTHWNFLADERECSLHSDSSPLKDVKTSIYGSHACLGMGKLIPTFRNSWIVC